MYQGIIFDLDGTLWDSTLQILPAWNIVLQRYNIEHRLSHQDIKGCMGKTAVQIAQRILPDEPLERSLQIVKACCQEELIYLQKSGGTLYPHLEKHFALWPGSTICLSSAIARKVISKLF